MTQHNTAGLLNGILTLTAELLLGLLHITDILLLMVWIGKLFWGVCTSVWSWQTVSRRVLQPEITRHPDGCSCTAFDSDRHWWNLQLLRTVLGVTSQPLDAAHRALSGKHSHAWLPAQPENGYTLESFIGCTGRVFCCRVE